MLLSVQRPCPKQLGLVAEDSLPCQALALVQQELLEQVLVLPVRLSSVSQVAAVRLPRRQPS